MLGPPSPPFVCGAPRRPSAGRVPVVSLVFGRLPPPNPGRLRCARRPSAGNVASVLLFPDPPEDGGPATEGVG